MLRTVLLAFFLLTAASPAFASAWYEGGNLQKGTVQNWKDATRDNQLATAADFAASLSGISDLATVQDPATLEQIKKKSLDLQACVNTTIQQEDEDPGRPIAELVVLCTIMKAK